MNDFKNLTMEQIDKALSDLFLMKDSLIVLGTDVEKQREKLMNAKQQKILETYPIRIWNASNGTWKAHVPDSSKPRNRKVLQGKTKENLEKKILEDYQKNCDERLIFKNYFPQWLLNYKSTYVKPGTLQRNNDDYKKFIQGTPLDSKRITDITPLELKTFLNKTINEYHLTKTAFSNLNSIFNGLFEHALEAGDIQKDPTANLKIENTNIRPEQAKSGKTEVFSDQEVELLAKYICIHYLDFQPIISLALLFNLQLGLRVGELCTLKKSDILFDENLICINRTERSYKPLELVDGKIVEHTTIHIVCEGETKSNSNRVLPLSDEALTIIKEVLRLQEEKNIKSEFLFPHENGEHVLRERYNDILEYYCKKVSIPVKSIHKTRKTVFSKLFASGMGLDEVMAFSGHRDKATLIKHYLFATNDSEGQRTKVAKALSNGVGFAKSF